MDITKEKQFILFIEQLELRLIELLKIKPEQLNSQLRKNEQLLFYTKFIQYYKKITTIVKSKNNEHINIYNLDSPINCKLKLIIDKIWEINDIYYYKYKIKEMIII